MIWGPMIEFYYSSFDAEKQISFGGQFIALTLLREMRSCNLVQYNLIYIGLCI